ncbi:hypothetical protein LJK88_14175 [Paenibacillus sp. P26]|nr:hypothetical protein LJK88_14175 [Paenibacillus sp. P26]
MKWMKLLTVASGITLVLAGRGSNGGAKERQVETRRASRQIAATLPARTAK